SSYGITGSDRIGDYKFYDTYSFSGRLYQGYSTLNPTALFNPEFSWEQTEKTEIGVELGFLHDRIFLEGSWYRNLSKNQLVQEPLPATTGFAYVFKNFNATIENAGIEAVLSVRSIDNEK